MTQQTTKLVADFGGTHLRIGFSDGFSVTKLSKVRYSSGVSSLELIIIKKLNKYESVPLDLLRMIK